MHGVNLDLLRIGPHHPDGRRKDPHDMHRAELRALTQAARQGLWAARLTRLFRFRDPALVILPGPPKATDLHDADRGASLLWLVRGRCRDTPTAKS